MLYRLKELFGPLVINGTILGVAEFVHTIEDWLKVAVLAATLAWTVTRCCSELRRARREKMLRDVLDRALSRCKDHPDCPVKDELEKIDLKL